MRREIWAGVLGALAAFLPDVAGAFGKARPQISTETVRELIERKPGSVQRVTFPESAWSAVTVVRGDGSKPPREWAEPAETITFAGPQARTVRVLRGDGEHQQPMAGHSLGMTTQLVTFASFEDRAVSIVRGSVPQAAGTELFGPAPAGDLDRIAFAVDGAESGHGSDLRMWRPEPSGPQGPMQVTAAAASDVGGGDRFDLSENRALGRAYLAHMYRRYGNWPDAVAAYNWGPGNLDAWIGAGRPAEKLPLEVERYRDRVLRDAMLAGRGAR